MNVLRQNFFVRTLQFIPRSTVCTKPLLLTPLLQNVAKKHFGSQIKESKPYTNRKLGYGNKFRLDFHSAKLESEETLAKYPKKSEKHFNFAAWLIETYNNPMHDTFNALTNETRPLYLDLIKKHLEIAIDIESEPQSKWIKSLKNRNNNDDEYDYANVPPLYICTFCDFLIHCDVIDNDIRMKNFEKANQLFIDYITAIENENENNDIENIDASNIEVFFNYAQFLDDAIKHFEKANEYYLKALKICIENENKNKKLLNLKTVIQLRYGFFLYKTQNFEAAIPYLENVIQDSGIKSMIIRETINKIDTKLCKDDKNKNDNANGKRQSLSDISAQMATKYEYDMDDENDNDNGSDNDNEADINSNNNEKLENKTEQIEKTKSIENQNGNKKLREMHYHGLFANIYLGALYLDLEKCNQASKYYTRVLNILNNYEIDDTNVTTMLLNECVLYFDKMNDFSNATDYYVQVLKLERILQAKLGTNNRQAESHNVNLDNLIIGAHLMSSRSDPNVKLDTRKEGLLRYNDKIKSEKETGIEKATKMFERIIQMVEGKPSKKENENNSNNDNNASQINFSLDKICYQNPYYYYGLHCLNQLENYEKAKQLFLKALQINPEFPTILFYLSLTCVYLNEFDNAKMYLEKGEIMNQDVINAKIALYKDVLQPIL